ncbi:MAG: hypothetical protein ABL933_04075 [Methyloglobulus sp.]|nr:hypothetical protein [Methyloglobulus sp.]
MFEVMPMKNRSSSSFKTRENLFVARYRDSHMTLPQIANKYDIGKEKIIMLLPKPDVVCPYGNHTRL